MTEGAEFRPYFFNGIAKGITAEQFLEKIHIHDAKILIEHIEPPKNQNGIYFAQETLDANTAAACFVIVHKIGAVAHISEVYGEKMSMDLKAGDVVMATKFLGSKIVIDDRTFRFITIDQIDGRL